MVYSMTGFGQAKAQYEDKTIKVDIRTLNGKSTDVRLKVPNQYRSLEMVIRKQVLNTLQRGKIDVNISIESPLGEEKYSLNPELIKSYYNELKAVNDSLNANTSDLLQLVMRIPNVVTASEDEMSESEKALVKSTVDQACNTLMDFREEDGKSLSDDLITQVSNIASLLDELPGHEAKRLESLRSRLTANIQKELKQERIDNSRFDQELFYYIEKLDISEEKTRLAQHLKHFKEVVESTESPKGRKLTFIGQEMGREINTLGAKAQDTSIQKLVVNMKDSLEKIKEQIANIL